MVVLGQMSIWEKSVGKIERTRGKGDGHALQKPTAGPGNVIPSTGGMEKGTEVLCRKPTDARQLLVYNST
jgi:hypothetical protein